MFNAANILEALKNYIHTRGGTSNAYNIAEAVNDLNSIPQGSGGDIPPEVSNAVETHGMGWTSEEEVEGFDISWDGDTTGLDVMIDAAYKVAEVDSITSASNLIGSTMEVIGIVDVENPHIFSSAEITTEDNKVFVCSVGSTALMVVAFEDGTTHDVSFTKGVWFMKVAENAYVSRLYKEASTEEVVHQIDQKYIPQSSGGGGMVVTFTGDDDGNLISDKTVSEVKDALDSTNVSCVVRYPTGDIFLTWQTLLDDDNGFILAFGLYQKLPGQNAYFFIPMIKEEDGEWVTNTP